MPPNSPTPRERGWSSGKAPLPVVALVTGAWSCFGQSPQLSGGVGEHDSSPYPNNWTLGFLERFGRLLNLGRVWLNRVCFSRRQDFYICLLLKKVRWDLQLYGARSAAGKALKGLKEVVGEGVQVIDEGVPTRHGAEHTQLILGLVDGPSYRSR